MTGVVSRHWQSIGRTCLPRRTDYFGLTRTWRLDLVAGLTVGIVALPLALGFGVTSGLGAAAGLVTAVIAGVLAAVFGGSRFQVSGPTGAMTVVLVPIVSEFGRNAVILVGILAGLMVIVMALTHLGKLVAYVPWPVVEGFTLGIATIIFLQQVPSAVNSPAFETDNTLWMAIQTAVHADWSAAVPSLGIVAIVIAVMFISPKIHPRIPGSLVGVVVATVLVIVAGLDISLIGALPTSLAAPSLSGLPLQELGSLIGPALAVAVLCAIESLLSARVADQMGGRVPKGLAWEPDRELFGQGLATVGSAIFGGMPATGAIARTAVNVRAGAQTRLAAIIHAVILLGVVYFAAPLVGLIPLAALAGVLIMTSIRMVERHAARSVLRSSHSDAALFVLTAVCTLAFDLILAVEAGLVLAAFFALRQMASRSTSEVTELEPGIVSLKVDGSLFFAAAPTIFADLAIPDGTRAVIVRLKDVQVLDASGAAQMADLISNLRSRGVLVLLKGVQDRHHHQLAVLGVIAAINEPYGWEDPKSVGHVFGDLDEAIAFAREAPSATELSNPELL